MKYTNEEYLQALDELYNLMDGLQTADQNIFQSGFDEALSNAMSYCIDEQDRIKKMVTK